MAQSDFSQRLAIADANQRRTMQRRNGLSSEDEAKIRLVRILYAPLCGVLGLFASFTIKYSIVNFMLLKQEFAQSPIEVFAIFGSAVLGIMLFLGFSGLALLMLSKFKKGQLRNYAVPAFFIGLAINSFAMTGAPFGGS